MLETGLVEIGAGCDVSAGVREPTDGGDLVSRKRPDGTQQPDRAIGVSGAAVMSDGFSVTKTHAPGPGGAGQVHRASSRGGRVTTADSGRVQPAGWIPRASSPPVRSSQSTPTAPQVARGDSPAGTAPAAARMASTNPGRVPASSVCGKPVIASARRRRSSRSSTAGSVARTAAAWSTRSAPSSVVSRRANPIGSRRLSAESARPTGAGPLSVG